MKRQSIWVAAIALAATGGVLTTLQTLDAAQPTVEPARVACVDVVQVFNEYDRQQDLSSEMSTLDQQIQAENTRRKQAIEAKRTALSQMDRTDPAFVQQRDELMKLELAYRNWTELMQAQMTREVAAWSQRVYQEILDATAAVAEQQGYDLVLYRDQFVQQPDNPEALRQQIRSRKVIYAADRIDITATVLQALNAEYAAQPKKKMIQFDMMIE